MPKQSKTKPKRPLANVVSALKKHKLLSILIALLLSVVGFFAYGKYLDWDNAQMIKGLSRDFPLLIEQIEQEAGLDLEVQSNCMTTQEKFSSGVRTCEYLAIDNNLKGDKLKKAQDTVLDSKLFGSKVISENNRGFRIDYRNKNSCTLSNLDRFYLSCIVAVRDANKDLAKLLN